MRRDVRCVDVLSQEEEEEFESDPVVQAVDAGPTEPAGNPHVADLATTDPYL